MKRTNWSALEKSAKLIKKNVKNLQQAGEFLREFPEEGYMRDNISKNLIKIKEAKSSSLRRYIKLLENFYYLVTSESDRKKILNKKIEIENELNTRDDGITENK